MLFKQRTDRYPREQGDIPFSEMELDIIEKRIYLDKEEKCIRFLAKEMRCSIDTMEQFQKKTPNVEQNCSEAEDTIYETLSLVDKSY